jgi:hypothetical protein
VDIGATLELKIWALKKHFSQIDTHDSERMIREWAEEEGKAGGLRHAESFRVMLLHKDEDSPRE